MYYHQLLLLIKIISRAPHLTTPLIYKYNKISIKLSPKLNNLKHYNNKSLKTIKLKHKKNNNLIH